MHLVRERGPRDTRVCSDVAAAKVVSKVRAVLCYTCLRACFIRLVADTKACVRVLSAGTGCKDGTVDVRFSNSVVGCDGKWSGNGITAGGTALCAANWHVCATSVELNRLGVKNCNAIKSSGQVFYATTESSVGAAQCTNDGKNTGTDDIWGCGKGLNGGNMGHPCGALNAIIGTDFPKPTGWNVGNNHAIEVKLAKKTTNGAGGVMCCSDKAVPTVSQQATNGVKIPTHAHAHAHAVAYYGGVANRGQSAQQLSPSIASRPVRDGDRRLPDQSRRRAIQVPLHSYGLGVSPVRLGLQPGTGCSPFSQSAACVTSRSPAMFKLVVGPTVGAHSDLAHLGPGPFA